MSLREGREDWVGVIEIAKIGEELFDAARFVVSRCNAEMMIADQFSRIGRYKEAEQAYETSLKIVQEALHEYDYQGDRAELWKLNGSLVIRWLGAIRMITTTPEGDKRFFGACFKAITDYRLLSRDIVLSAVGSLRKWADAHLNRPQVSEHTKADADVNERRLKKLLLFIKPRPEFSRIADFEWGQMDKLLKDLDSICHKVVAKV